jgi:serine/threonine protein kinase
MRSGDVVARRFHVERFAGAGAMGLVYRARDAETGEWVALKVLAHGSAGRFLREARALAEIVHPHIVRYVDHGHTAEGEPYLAMEWLEGADLALKLQAGALPMAQPSAFAGPSPGRSRSRTAGASCTATSSRATSFSWPAIRLE